MTRIFQVSLQLALLRGSPADFPAMPVALFGLIALHVVSVPIYLAIVGEGGVSWFAVYVANALMLISYALVLAVNGRSARIMQTLSALLAVDLLLLVANVVLILLATPAGVEIFWLSLGIFFWWLLASSRILAAALEWNPALAFLLVFALNVLGQTVLSTLSPPPDPAAAALLSMPVGFV